jgi:NAD(P)-dependent dehydrogenase (short-subunit alcohol dehydrogenase family)
MVMVMNLNESVALVTGANRGLGARLVQELLRAGAAKVYATSRTPGAVAADVAADPRVVTLTLDITDPASVKAAPELVAERIVAALAAGETVVFPDDASAGAGAVYLQDPIKLEQMLLGG